MTTQIEHLRQTIHVENRKQSRKVQLATVFAFAGVLGAGLAISGFLVFHL
jgi:hypothetical protein